MVVFTRKANCGDGAITRYGLTPNLTKDRVFALAASISR